MQKLNRSTLIVALAELFPNRYDMDDLAPLSFEEILDKVDEVDMEVVRTYLGIDDNGQQS